MKYPNRSYPAKRLFPFLGIVFGFLLSACASDKPALSLRRGVNLSHWFSQTKLPEYPPLQATDADMALIVSLGFDHVRLPVDPSFLCDFSADIRLKEEPLHRLDEALRMIISNDLRVVVDMHPRPDFKDRLEQDPVFLARFKDFWSELAKHLSAYDRRYLALEILNEPMVKDSEHWQKMIATLHGTVRQSAPEHTIIISGGEWSDIRMMRQLVPLKDRNLIYTFHFYEPHIFTHQGARWGLPEWKKLTGVSYPPSAENAEDIFKGLDDQEARSALQSYLAAGWNSEKISEAIREAAVWAEERGVVLWCGEFGVYRTYAPSADRARYLEDVRTALERYGIGWALWDYQGSFSIVEKNKKNNPENQASPDLPVVKALGLITGE